MSREQGSIEVLHCGDASGGVRNVVDDGLNDWKGQVRPLVGYVLGKTYSTKVAEHFTVEDFDLSIALMTVWGDPDMVDTDHSEKFFDQLGDVRGAIV